MVRETKMWHVAVMLTMLIGCLVYALAIADTSVHIPLFAAAIMMGVFAMTVLGYQWESIQSSIFDSVRTVSIALILLCVIGMVIATWILSGVVPTMIYYGLQIINPRFFLFSAAVLCAMVSLPTGSSWTTAGTVGIALMGIGEGLGVPAPMTAGAILSGAYFGDKLSPLSDTSNLAVAVSDANIVDHIKHMLWTSVPAFVLALIGFVILGSSVGGNSVQSGMVDGMLATLQANYNISPLLLLVPVVVIGIVIMRVPAIPGLFFGAVLGGVIAMFTQEGVSLVGVIEAMHEGVVVETGNEMVDDLLTRGGVAGMYDTLALIICMSLVSGVLDATRATEVLTAQIIKAVRSNTQLVAATIASGTISNCVIADQYIAIMITGKMFQKSYTDKGLATKNLSRTLEDSATLTSPLIPWNTCGAYMIATLGIAPWVYIPFALFNILMPVLSIVAAYFNFKMPRIEDELEAESVVAAGE